MRISRVAVAQGNLTVRVTETPQVSQPNPLAEGDTVVVPRTRVEVDEQVNGNMVAARGGRHACRSWSPASMRSASGPRDLIGILQAIKAAGALQAEIVVM